MALHKDKSYFGTLLVYDAAFKLFYAFSNYNSLSNFFGYIHNT